MEKHLFISSLILFLNGTCVLCTLFVRRMIDIKKGVTDAKYFKTYDLQTTIPNTSKQLTRNFTNQFETPVYFFILILLVLHFGVIDQILVNLSYLYVGLRFTHTLIHVTKNKMIPRMLVFATSILTLAVMWFYAAFTLLGK